MGRQVAVAVGVANVPGLPYLAGVAPGTAAFAAWAGAQGFEVTVYDDAVAPVTAVGILATVRAAVEAGDVERLFIFFSGHGMEMGIGEDFWLLSGVADSTAEAVNVAKSVQLARRSGICHVAFFADACRTPYSPAFNGLTGTAIFPPSRLVHPVEVDTFYATVSGDPAYEPTASGEPMFGIFTDCLLDALRGDEPDVLKDVPGGPKPLAVLARPLAKHLRDEVRLRSAQRVHVTQTPDCIASSDWEPNAIAWLDPAPPAAGAGEDGSDGVADEAPPKPPERRAAGPGYGYIALPGAVYNAVSPAAVRRRQVRAHDEDRRGLAERVAADVAARPGRSHFETRIGLTVVGARIAAARVGREELGAFAEDGNDHVRVDSDQPLAALVRLTDPDVWLATAVFPGYVTTLTTGAEGTQHTAFVAIGDDAEEELRAIAAIAAAARLGRRDFVDDDDTLRLIDRGNPTVAVLAAYAYDRLGRADDVARIADRCLDRLGVLPYDVALLAEADDAQTVPEYPLMARGWALADTLPAGDEWFRYGRARLTPAPWTTFREADEDALSAFGKRR